MTLENLTPPTFSIHNLDKNNPSVDSTSQNKTHYTFPSNNTETQTSQDEFLLHDIPLELDENDNDTSTEMFHMVDVYNNVLMCYLNERFSPELLRNPLDYSCVMTLRRATVEATEGFHSTCPSLDPKNRIEFLTTSQSIYRALYILQSYVFMRITKILTDPFCLLTSKYQTTSVMEATPLTKRHCSQSSNSQNIPDSTSLCTHTSEGNALTILEHAFAKELAQIWETFSIIKPQEQCERFTQAETLPNVSLAPLERIDAESSFLEKIQNINHTNQISTLESLSYGQSHGSYFPSNCTMVLKYNAIRHLLEKQVLTLTG